MNKKFWPIFWATIATLITVAVWISVYKQTDSNKLREQTYAGCIRNNVRADVVNDQALILENAFQALAQGKRQDALSKGVPHVDALNRVRIAQRLEDLADQMHKSRIPLVNCAFVYNIKPSHVITNTDMAFNSRFDG